jgi:hypothetical protein
MEASVTDWPFLYMNGSTFLQWRFRLRVSDDLPANFSLERSPVQQTQLQAGPIQLNITFLTKEGAPSIVILEKTNRSVVMGQAISDTPDVTTFLQFANMENGPDTATNIALIIVFSLLGVLGLALIVAIAIWLKKWLKKRCRRQRFRSMEQRAAKVIPRAPLPPAAPATDHT